MGVAVPPSGAETVPEQKLMAGPGSATAAGLKVTCTTLVAEQPALVVAVTV